MYSFKLVTLVTVALSNLVVSQSFNASSVNSATKAQWCTQQKTSCPLLCTQIGATTAKVNNCTSSDLSYECLCNNGQSPNASQYSQTIPYFICTEENQQCETNCNGDSTCQSACQTDHPCGAQDPIRVNTTSTTAAAAATSTGTTTGATYNGFGGATTTAASAASRIGALSVSLGQTYGLALIIAGFFAGFTLLL
ncbi:hypothetical protein MMC20_005997 [Loxospora ochrophaea]|nr:hypothetical protein [Loxospora ochrophaea]